MVGPSSRTLILQFSIGIERFGHDNHALPWDFVLFQKLADDDLVFPGRVGIGSVKRLVLALKPALLTRVPPGL